LTLIGQLRPGEIIRMPIDVAVRLVYTKEVEVVNQFVSTTREYGKVEHVET
jgi:hypothetical protein